MPKFIYTAKDAKGRTFKDVAEAESKYLLISQLKNQGLAVLQIEEERKTLLTKRSTFSIFTLFKPSRIRISDLALFFQQLSTTIEAGLSLVESVETIASEVEKKEFKDVLMQVASDMREGFTFSESLSRYPDIFSGLVVSLVEAAEESGNMIETLSQLTGYLERRDALIRKVRTASVYPAVIFSFFIFVVTVVTLFLIPRFEYIYTGFGGKLPLLTRVIFEINRFLIRNAGFFIVAILALAAAGIYYFRSVRGRKLMDRIQLSMPVFGSLFKRAAISKFCRSLSILLHGGVPISRALEIVSRTAGNSLIEQAVDEARAEILDGVHISAALRKSPLFPRMMIRMTTVGEESGSLAKLLGKVADFYDQQIDSATTAFTSIVEPLLVICIGGLVLLLVLAIYLPIFSMAMTMGR